MSDSPINQDGNLVGALPHMLICYGIGKQDMMEAARALKAVSNELFVRGYRLKVFEAYRPVCAVKSFVLWGIEDQDQRMKAYFYSTLEKDELFINGYISK